MRRVFRLLRSPDVPPLDDKSASVATIERADEAASIIAIHNVSKSYRVNNATVPVLDGLSHQVRPRSFLSIVGPSGCGKSTLLKMIAGLEPPTAGQIVFNGRVVNGPPKGLIYVFQQYTKSIFPWRTVIQNVEFGLRSQVQVTPREAAERCREYLRLVGLEGYENYFPYQLSGGMQQRVVIARALICEPAALLMDEPFSAVDAMTRALLQELLLKIWQALPITVLFVTHDIDEAVLLSSDIVALGRSPAGIRERIVNPLPYPRDQVTTPEEPAFVKLRQQLFGNILRIEKGEATNPGDGVR